jgi:hypothetical protein
MTKKITAVTGEYVAQDGTQKAEFTDLGVLILGKNGKEYLMLKPEISLSGILIKQNALAIKRGEQPRDMVMTSVIEQQANQAPQQSYQNQPNPTYQQPQQRPQTSNQPNPRQQNNMPQDDFGEATF